MVEAFADPVQTPPVLPPVARDGQLNELRNVIVVLSAHVLALESQASVSSSESSDRRNSVESLAFVIRTSKSHVLLLPGIKDTGGSQSGRQPVRLVQAHGGRQDQSEYARVRASLTPARHGEVPFKYAANPRGAHRRDYRLRAHWAEHRS